MPDTTNSGSSTENQAPAKDQRAHGLTPAQLNRLLPLLVKLNTCPLGAEFQEVYEELLKALKEMEASDGGSSCEQVTAMLAGLNFGH